MFRIRIGDVLERLAEMEPESFDGCFTDPPYGLTQGKKGGSGPASVNLASPYGRARITTGFMGMKWDGAVPGVDVWAEVLRVLKPGAMLLAFGGTRTHHRLMCAIEDAGFEIRDCCMWLYGSGFPKSLDISKAIDKAAGADREVIGVKAGHEDFINRTDAHSAGGRSEGWERNWRNDPNAVLKSHLKTAPSTGNAKRFNGYGTALKPAWEPIIVAMKPLDGTFAGNALKHGVAGINVDGCRIGSEVVGWGGAAAGGNTWNDENCGLSKDGAARPVMGRWPANVLLDEEAGAALDQQSGTLSSGANPTSRNSDKFRNTYSPFPVTECVALRGADTGGASRFFYCAKASRSDRGSGNDHPTVKPRRLCAYLATLILPPSNRRLLVPYSGSGSEMLGALDAGWNTVIGIEKEQKYIDIARSRLA